METVYSRSMQQFRQTFPDQLQPATRLRLRLYILHQHQQEPIMTRLIADYGLSVTIHKLVLETPDFPRQIDLELSGKISQIQQGLSYLETVSLAIQGKPNTDGDSWYC